MADYTSKYTGAEIDAGIEKALAGGMVGPQGPAGAPGKDGAPGAKGDPGEGVPTGGTAGQVLSKVDGTDYNTTWANASAGIPSGGTTGQVLTKESSADYAAKWADASAGLGKSLAGQSVRPTSGTTVTAGEGAEIFNDYQARTFSGTSVSAGNVASGYYSHAEGYGTTANGVYGAHAEGYGVVASGFASHAEGNESIASGSYAHSEGDGATASGDYSHAEGHSTTASGIGCHAEGRETTASGNYSHAEGYKTTTAGWESSHAEGEGTTAGHSWQHVGGSYNVVKGFDGTFSYLVIGKGISNSARANCFRVTDTGTYAAGSYNASGADYAELFEWADGNPEAEDRAGLFVTLDGKKIRLASPEDDYILGVVSACPSVVGDVYDDQWKGMEVRDVFGRIVKEMQDVPARTIEVSGKTVEISPATRALLPAINPDYDPETKYIPRTERPEWDAVGLLGKLVAVDDGTCEENGWATVGEGGTATASEMRTKYRVMERLDETHVQLMIL